METLKYHVENKPISLDVEIEITEFDGKKGISIHSIMKGFAKAYVKSMTENALVSADCLIHCIGFSKTFEAMIEGYKEQTKEHDPEEMLPYYNRISDRRDFENYVLDEWGGEGTSFDYRHGKGAWKKWCEGMKKAEDLLKLQMKGA